MAKALSLHIGLNRVDPDHYQGWAATLYAAENDAVAVAHMCASRGYETTTLLSEQATRSAVLGWFRGAAETLATGDSLLLSFSGCGGRLPDLNGDAGTGFDATWCLYDAQLLDDELQRAWARLPGVKIVQLFDAAHGGTPITNLILTGRLADLGASLSPSGGAARVMPPPIVHLTYKANRDMYDRLLTQPVPGLAPEREIVSLRACDDNQLASDGLYHGAFTGALLSVWNDGRFSGGYRELVDAARAKLPMVQSPALSFTGNAGGALASTRAFEPEAPSKSVETASTLAYRVVDRWVSERLHSGYHRHWPELSPEEWGASLKAWADRQATDIVARFEEELGSSLPTGPRDYVPFHKRALSRFVDFLTASAPELRNASADIAEGAAS